MKHQDGRLWVYNKPFLKPNMFLERPKENSAGIEK